jgi:D-lactate dehydrogenase
VPLDWGCCGFAATDRGMLQPQAAASATVDQAARRSARPTDAHVSCNRICELAMTRATGSPYRHVIELFADLVTAATIRPASSIPRQSQ